MTASDLAGLQKAATGPTPPTAAPTTPRPAQAAPAAPRGPMNANSLQQMVKTYKPPKQIHDPSLLRRGLAGLQWAAESPVGRGLDAVLNASSRAGTAAIAGKNPLDAVMHPAQTMENAHAAERNTLGRLGIGQPSNPIIQGAEDFLVQTLADPATYIPGLDVVSVGKRIAGVGRLIPGAERAAKVIGESSPVQRALSGAVEGHDLRRGVQRPGEDVVKGHEIAGYDALNHQEQQYGDLIEKHRPLLGTIERDRASLRTEMAQHKEVADAGYAPAKQLMQRLQQQYDNLGYQVPKEIRQALLQRAYREGTPTVRRQVLARGYKPTAEDRALPVLNILHKFRDEYEPTQTLFDKEALDRTSGPVRYTAQGNRKATFDLSKEGGKPEDPLADRLLDRLVRGARLENYHATRRNILGGLGLLPAAASMQRTLQRIDEAKTAGDTVRTQRYTDLLGKQQAAFKSAEETRAKTLKPDAAMGTQPLELKAGEQTDVAAPEAILDRLFGDKAKYNHSLMRTFSDLQRDALFIIPFAHMKNIAVLAALGPGGGKTIVNGLRYAHQLRTNPAALEARVKGLEGIGASSHYIRDVEPAYTKIPGVGGYMAAVAKKSNAALERYDMGMRMALEDELKRKGVEGFAAGGHIRDVLGDYVNQAPLIQELRNRWGANFPGWRLGVVPRAMTKAIREQPRAVKAYARAAQVGSDDVTQPMFGSDFDVGGPAEDYAKMFEGPSFYTSPSTLGPVANLYEIKDAMARGKVAPYIGQEALRYTPGGATIGSAAGFPYPSNAPAAARAAAAPFGSYFRNRPDIKQRTNQLRSLGMKGPEIHEVLRSEGYYRQAQ